MFIMINDPSHWLLGVGSAVFFDPETHVQNGYGIEIGLLLVSIVIRL